MGETWSFQVLRVMGLVGNSPIPTMLFLLLHFYQKGYFLLFGRKTDSISTTPLTMKSFRQIPIPMILPFPFRM